MVRHTLMPTSSGGGSPCARSGRSALLCRRNEEYAAALSTQVYSRSQLLCVCVCVNCAPLYVFFLYEFRFLTLQPQNEHIELHQKRFGRRLDHEERTYVHNNNKQTKQGRYNADCEPSNERGEIGTSRLLFPSAARAMADGCAAGAVHCARAFCWLQRHSV